MTLQNRIQRLLFSFFELIFSIFLPQGCNDQRLPANDNWWLIANDRDKFWLARALILSVPYSADFVVLIRFVGNDRKERLNMYSMQVDRPSRLVDRLQLSSQPILKYQKSYFIVRLVLLVCLHWIFSKSVDFQQ